MAYLQLSMERQKNISKVIKLWHSAAAYMFPGFCYLPSWLLTSIIVIVLTFFFFLPTVTPIFYNRPECHGNRNQWHIATDQSSHMSTHLGMRVNKSFSPPKSRLTCPIDGFFSLIWSGTESLQHFSCRQSWMSVRLEGPLHVSEADSYS